MRPELDDALAGKFQQGSIDSLKEAIKKDIIEQKTIAAKREQESEIAEALLKITKIEVPESLIEQETHRMIDEMRKRTEMMGLPFEQYLIQIKKTEADLHHEFKTQAEKTVKVGLILGEIGKAEKLDLKDENAGHKVMEKLIEYAKK
jgi:trigger factor